MMKGKVCLITGATNGIGLETARELLKQGGKIVIVGRNPTKTAAVVQELRQSTGSDHVDFLLADLAQMAQVKQLAHDFKQRYDRLDVLVNNAGGFFMQRLLTADGLEMTFALNHLSYFILTNLLVDILVDSAPARIVSVSSDAHRGGTINFNQLQGENGYSGFNAYSQSKLMNVLFTLELARRLDGTGVVANAVHPGFVGTGFGTNNGFLMKTAMMLFRPFIRKPAQGATSSIRAASALEMANVSGKYLNADGRIVDPSPAALDPEMQRRLWAISEEITGVTMPAIRA